MSTQVGLRSRRSTTRRVDASSNRVEFGAEARQFFFECSGLQPGKFGRHDSHARVFNYSDPADRRRAMNATAELCVEMSGATVSAARGRFSVESLRVVIDLRKWIAAAAFAPLRTAASAPTPAAR